MMDSDQRKEDDSARAHPELRCALRWYLLGFALLGGAVGFFAGSSRSPVIATLLPLLFGMVGGVGGLYIARAPLSKPETAIRLRILGKALTLFIFLTFLGSCYGISLRTGRSLRSFVSASIFMPEPRAVLSTLGSDHPTRLVQLVMLRARVRALGVSLDEEQLILRSVADSMRRASSDSLATISDWSGGGINPRDIDRLLSLLCGSTGAATLRPPDLGPRAD